MMEQAIHKSPPATIVIFGASGDLTHRKLVPALHTLSCRRLLSSRTHVIGVSRSEYSDDEFRDRLYDGIEEYSRAASNPGNVCQLWPDYARNYSYLAGDLSELETYERLGERLASLVETGDAESTSDGGGNVLFYLAVPPTLYTMIVERLGQAGLNRSNAGWRRVIVEKPFGHDLASARRLNEQLHTVFDESQIYRIDHYLGKETVQNIMSFRFANAIFEPIWNRNYIGHVQISVAETVGVGHRAGYYEHAGVLRDMFQNHLMQLLTLTALEPPAAFEADALRDEKAKVLQAISPITESVRGQYRAYRDEKEVAPDSDTATYAALKLWVDNWRWRGVPFYLRSGKRLALKTTEIAIEFKCVPHLMFAIEPRKDITPDVLSLCIQPNEGIHLRFQAKEPGAGMRTRPVTMEFHYASHFGTDALPDAYERLLLDALNGDASLFGRADEIERAWSLIDPVLERWRGEEAPPLGFYESGTWGPPQADRLIASDGRAWHQQCCTGGGQGT
ncbi:MAG: glucose-6-phosphate dehydrogenase [Anaerolineae bacterium]|jgi:glucose-6-phosphate 1-dehydrogenase